MTKPKDDLSPEAVRRLLLYDPHTGLWQWRIFGSGKKKGGWFAGSLNRKDGYLRIMIAQRAYQTGRLAWLWMTGAWPKDRIDHIDLDKINNRWGNLREATSAQNQSNRRRPKNNTSSVKGVHFAKGRWQVRIQTNGKRIHLGSFATIDEAEAAYREASSRHHGEYGRLQ